MVNDIDQERAPINLEEIEQFARQVLPQMAHDYFISGANDEITLRENLAAYQRIFLSPRMLVDVSQRSMTTTICGVEISMPIIVAPTAFHGLAHPEGEVATARAAARAETIMTLSTLSNSSLEDVAAAANGRGWFQLYVYKDRSITAAMVQRAETAGYKALVLTVDAPVIGRRERDVRNRFSLPANLSMANLFAVGLNKLPKEFAESGLAAYSTLFDASLTWRDVEWLRSISKLPILVKGILRADDAVLAVQHGASGVIVSNHGGRQLDTVPASITVLPRIADAIGDSVELLIDGGIRRGTDVLKAIALGAKAVLIGRPILWGLAMDGENGVHLTLETLRTELDLAMALSGVASINRVPSDLIFEN